jgi:hypothetical protein
MRNLLLASFVCGVQHFPNILVLWLRSRWASDINLAFSLRFELLCRDPCFQVNAATFVHRKGQCISIKSPITSWFPWPSLDESPCVVSHGSLSLLVKNPSTSSQLTSAQELGSWGVDHPLSEDVPLRSSTSLFHTGKQYLGDASHILPQTGSHHREWTFHNSLRHPFVLFIGQPRSLTVLAWS